MWIPGERGLELAQQIVGGPLELVRDAGHLVQEDEPEQLSGLLEDHLSAVFA